MIVVMRLQSWDTLACDNLGGLRMDKGSVPGTVGFLPVYADRASAEKDYPDGPFAEIQEAKHG